MNQSPNRQQYHLDEARSPEKDGLKSLKQYQKAKAKIPMKSLTSSSLMNADGSLVALAYKESKSRDLSLSLLEKGPEEDISPLKDRTNSLRNDDRTVLNVYMNNQLDLQSSELQYYEEQLFEIAERLELVSKERDTLRLEKEKLEKKQELLGQMNNDNDLKKVYMDNQLDLQNTEMQYYEEQLDQIASQLENVMKERDDLTIERDNLIQQIQSQETKQGNDYAQVLEEKDNAIEELKLNLSAVEKELEQCNMMFEGLNDQLDRKDTTIEQLNIQNNSLIKKNEEINSFLVDLNTEKAQLLEEMSSVNTLLASKDAELSLMENSLNEFQVQFDAIRPVVEERNKTIQELKIQNKQYREQLSKVETELSAVKDNIHTAEDTKIQEFEMQIQERADIIAQLEQNVINWQMAYKQIEDSNLMLENYKLELESTVAGLQSKLDSSSIEINSYINRISSLESEVEQVTEQNKDYAQSLAESRFALAASEDLSSNLQSKLDSIDQNQESNLQNILQEKQRIELEIQELASRMDEKDQFIADLTEKFNLKEMELLKVREDSDHLQDLLIKVQEKEDVTDEILLTLKSERDDAIAALKEKEDVTDELLLTLKSERDDAITALKESHNEISKRDGAIEIYNSELEQLQTLYNTYTEGNNAVDSKSTLILKVESLEKSISSLQNQLQERNLEKDDLELKLKLMKHSLDELQESSVMNKESTISANSSQLDISQITRSQKILEDENDKLRGIVDHLRTVNNKLMEDIKVAHEECLKYISIENRLKSTEQNEILLEQKLKKAEAALMKKDIEILEAVGKAQVADDKLLVEKEVEINALRENVKDKEEKWQTALREIELLRQAELETTNSQIDELQNLFHKISMHEKQIAEQSHLLEVNDRTIKNIQSNIIEKESKIEELESERNELRMSLAANLISAPVVEIEATNIVEMEATISSLKEQIAVLEASNIAREDALATAMTKYAEFLDEARDINVESEKHKAESLSRAQDNEILQLRIGEAQIELATLQEEYTQLRNVTHRNTLQQLASAEDNVRELSDELNLTKGDLKNANSSISSLKDNVKSLEQRLQALYDEYSNTLDQIQTSKQNLQNKIIENDQLRVQLDETVEKLSSVRSQLGTSEEQSAKIRTLEEHISILTEKLSYVELIELEVAQDMKEFALSNDVGKVNDLFASPIPSNNDSERPLLQGILDSVRAFKLQYDELVQRNQLLDSEIRRMIEDQKRAEALEQSMHMMMYERDLIATQTVIEAVEIVIRQSQAHVVDLEHKLSKTTSRINAAIKPTVAKPIHRTSIALPEVTDGIDAVSNILTVAFNNLGDYLASVSDTIETLSSENVATREVYEKYEVSSLEKVQNLNTERMALIEQITSLQKSHKENEREKYSIKDLIANKKDELVKKDEEIHLLRSKLNDYATNTNELESEYRKSVANVDDLRSALKEAEALCIHLRGRIRLLQGDVELKDKDIQNLSSDLETYRKKLINTELNYEKSDALAERLKAEVSTLENTRHHLETELERSRIELLGLKVSSSSLQGGDEGYQFEVEKLIAALKLTLDHMTSLSSSTAVSHSKDEMIPTLSSFDSNYDTLSFSDRVNILNQKLTEFRTWSRNEFRSHRQLETRIQSLEEDLMREHRLQDEMNRLLSISEQTKSEREALLMRNEFVIADLQATVNKYQESQKSNNDNDEKLQIQLEVEQQHNHKLTLELKMKDSEVLSLSKSLENLKNEYSKLQKKNEMVNQKLVTFSQGDATKEDDARVAKASLASLTAKFDSLQREFEFSERSRISAERKAVDYEITTSTLNRLKEQLKEASNSNNHYKNDLKAALHEKETAELSSEFKSRELESAKQRVLNLEARLANNQKEKEEMADEISDLRHALMKSKERADHESTVRMQLEKSLESTRHLDATENGSLKARLNQMQNEILSLRGTLSSITIDNKEKENIIINENNKRVKVEDELIKIKKTLDNTNREHSKMCDRFSITRVEKGQLEEQIRSISNKVNELIMLAKLYSNATGIHINLQAIDTINNDPNAHSDNNGSENILTAIDNMCTIFDILTKKIKANNNNDITTYSSNNNYNSDEKLRKLKEDLMLVQAHSDRNSEIQNRLLKSNSSNNNSNDNNNNNNNNNNKEKKEKYDKDLPHVSKDKVLSSSSSSSSFPLRVVNDTGSATLRTIKVTKTPTK